MDGSKTAKTTSSKPTKPSDFQPEFHFRTYGDQTFVRAKTRLVQEANDTGWFQTVQAWGPEMLPTDFRKKYSKILSQPRGGGYWIWKYPLLEETMETIREGDFVIYLDAGCRVNGDAKQRFDEYAKLIQESPFDQLCMQLSFPEYQYTTEQTFQILNVAKNDTAIRDSRQVVGGILMIRKGDNYRKWMASIQKVLEQDPYVVTDKYNDDARRANPQFIDHRHDQSLSSITRKQGGCVFLQDESYPPGQADKPFWASRLKE